MPEARPLRRAAFLDRDGTICEEMGYVNHVDRLQIFPFAAAAIRQLNEAQVLVDGLVVVSMKANLVDIERPGAVDVANGQDDELDFPVHTERSPFGVVVRLL